MSTTDPDARAGAIRSALRPLAWAAVVVALVAGPVAGLIMSLAAEPDAAFVAVYLPWLLVTVGFGLFAYYVVRHIPGLSIAAYCVAGGGAMFLIFGAPAAHTDAAPLRDLVPAIVLYAVALLLYVVQRVRSGMQQQTLRDGVSTTATVRRAAIMGRVNAAPLWHLTLTFTDQQGTQRWFRTHLLGISWSPGDTVPIRYDPARPRATGRIVVAPGSEGDMLQ